MCLRGFLLCVCGFIVVYAKPQPLSDISTLYQEPLQQDGIENYFRYISDSTADGEDEFAGLLDKHASIKGSAQVVPPDERLVNVSDPLYDAAPNMLQFGYTPMSPDPSHDFQYPMGSNQPSGYDSDWSIKQEADPWQPQKRFNRPGNRRGPVMHRWQKIWGSPGKRLSPLDEATGQNTKRMVVPYGHQIDSRLLNYYDADK